MNLTLTRGRSSDQGTPGELRGFDFEFASLELPWRDLNGDGLGDPQKSCITPGTYQCSWRESPRFGWCYEVTGVKGRSHVLIHAGNYAGDRAEGYKCHVEGCILLGKAAGILDGQRAVLQSRDAIKEFHSYTKQQPFALTVKRG